MTSFDLCDILSHPTNNLDFFIFFFTSFQFFRHKMHMLVLWNVCTPSGVLMGPSGPFQGLDIAALFDSLIK